MATLVASFYKGNIMKVVVVADWLTNMGGGENVIEEIVKTFDNPTIYTSVVNKDKLSPVLKSARIIASSLQGKKERIENHIKYFPFMPHAFKHLEIEPCDVVITSSSSCAKMVKIPKGAIHIVYCHTPMRYAWVMEKEYLHTLSWWKRPLAKVLLAYMRHQDLKSNKHVDYFIANSECTKERIKKYYDRDATVIYPNVDVSRFPLSYEDDGYYLVASRLVYYKRIDLAVKACTKLNKKLIIVGQGAEFDNLKKIAGPTVEFLGHLSGEKLVDVVAHSKAFLFPGEEDFGIAPLEAMSAGKPVIAFNRGGALETVIDNKTGVFFNEQTVDSLVDAINRFEALNFDKNAIHEHASKFASNVFSSKIKAFVEECFRKHFVNTDSKNS